MKIEDQMVEDIYGSQAFKALAKKRRRIAVGLLSAAGLFFFAQPVLFNAFPDFFRIRISSAITLGFVYTLAQYVMGGVVAVYFALSQGKLDRAVEDIRHTHRKNSASASGKLVPSQEA